MHPKTRYHNLYLPATESRETTQKHCFEPKELDWACSLRKNKTQLRKHKVVHCMHPKPVLITDTSRQRNLTKPPRNLVLGLKKRIGQVRCEKTRRNFGITKWCILCTPKPDLTTGTSPATESRETTWKLSFGPKEVDWACSLQKNKTQLRKHKVVHFMHPKTRSHNLYLPATESRETTQKLSFGPQEVDLACSLRKNKTQLWKHKVVHFMHSKTRSHNLYLPATESRETTQKLSFGPKEVDWACSLRKNKTQLR